MGRKTKPIRSLKQNEGNAVPRMFASLSGAERESRKIGWALHRGRRVEIPKWQEQVTTSGKTLCLVLDDTDIEIQKEF